MRRTSPPLRRTALVLMAACALLPMLLALIAVGMGAAAPTTQGLTQATGALSAAAFQGLDRRAVDFAPLLTRPGLAFEAIALVRAGRNASAPSPAHGLSASAPLPLRL